MKARRYCSGTRHNSILKTKTYHIFLSDFTQQSNAYDGLCITGTGKMIHSHPNCHNEIINSNL